MKRGSPALRQSLITMHRQYDSHHSPWVIGLYTSVPTCLRRQMGMKREGTFFLSCISSCVHVYKETERNHLRLSQHFPGNVMSNVLPPRFRFLIAEQNIFAVSPPQLRRRLPQVQYDPLAEFRQSSAGCFFQAALVHCMFSAALLQLIRVKTKHLASGGCS